MRSEIVGSHRGIPAGRRRFNAASGSPISRRSWASSEARRLSIDRRDLGAGLGDHGGQRVPQDSFVVLDGGRVRPPTAAVGAIGLGYGAYRVGKTVKGLGRMQSYLKGDAAWKKARNIALYKQGK